MKTLGAEMEGEIVSLYKTREFGLRDLSELFGLGLHQIRNVLQRHRVVMNKSHSRLSKKAKMQAELSAHRSFPGSGQ
ncbi:MAG: hypothetical protein HOB79_14585 [Rhodospirillaceae bacterium]|jgi:hypothetical protein|nr:hypothetical protein [Rhodospirillales bacterium]MBT3906279.1 hypothetical protein [Rhodospirillaceae bacterium]MBT4702295.1 hypothetical protein [Rhodospirillaceae bacterium]MBT5033403.1 hypothetical protein [Rhodospirillaceae bacterium]MBT6218260.1 hypothetical protein [Rhodospirillaceae bacterium]